MVAVHQVTTPEKEDHLVVEARTNGIVPVADGSDMIPVYVTVCDRNGSRVYNSQKEITFQVSGEGSLIGGWNYPHRGKPAKSGRWSSFRICAHYPKGWHHQNKSYGRRTHSRRDRNHYPGFLRKIPSGRKPPHVQRTGRGQCRSKNQLMAKACTEHASFEDCFRSGRKQPERVSFLTYHRPRSTGAGGLPETANFPRPLHWTWATKLM